MEHLTEKTYWNEVHESKGGRLERLAKSLISKPTFRFLASYPQHVLWSRIYAPFLPTEKNLTVLEVGSSPGNHLVRLHRTYGYMPYGVDYSESGVEENRRVFARNGIDPENIIKADFFSREFLEQNRERFDIVFSRGFVEHFRDVRSVVARHRDLVKPGGTLVISIPNFSGINRLLFSFFNRAVLEKHNLDIMAIANFRQLFACPDLTSLFCSYFGTFDFGLFNTNENSPRRHLLTACRGAQMFLNVLFRILFRNRGFDGPRHSPYLIYIGRKCT
jgi:2-polyprenyl-3-methyl-5-hydroxy-6-metoxy-1,4-benzoquinol methylase